MKVRNEPFGQLVQLCPGDQSLLSVPVDPLDPGLLSGQVVPVEDSHQVQLIYRNVTLIQLQLSLYMKFSKET